MSKEITIRFIIDDKEDEDVANRALNADKYCSALWNIQQYCRDVQKHGLNADDTIEEIRKSVFRTGFEEVYR